MTFEANLKRIRARHEELAALLAGHDGGAGWAELSKEYAQLQPVVDAAAGLDAALNERGGLQEMISDSGEDAEMRALAEQELRALDARVPELARRVRILLLPKDEADARNAVLEIRAGTGGGEAALFAADLYRMYQRYADARGWRFEPVGASETGIGGLKEGAAVISGAGVFARLKYESGVHRVQRVPATESGGRIHTSAATVAVMPEAEDVDVRIDEKDLRIDVFRASGPGGQSVNTTDSAVRVTHIPTGVTVSQQDEKSQHKNKAKAMKVLMARLYDAERARAEAERAADRKGQVGSGDRSERIRTYNFPQGRVTDHRIGLTLHALDKILEGALDLVIGPLLAEDEARRLAAAQ